MTRKGALENGEKARMASDPPGTVQHLRQGLDHQLQRSWTGSLWCNCPVS